MAIVTRFRIAERVDGRTERLGHACSWPGLCAQWRAMSTEQREASSVDGFVITHEGKRGEPMGKWVELAIRPPVPNE